MAVVPYESASRVVMGDAVGSESTVCWMDGARISPASLFNDWPTRTHEGELPTKSVGHLRRHDRDRLSQVQERSVSKSAQKEQGGLRTTPASRRVDSVVLAESGAPGSARCSSC